MRPSGADRVYVSQSIAEPVKQALATRAVGLYGAAWKLTSREREVLQLLAEGRSAKAIAAELNLSPRTVEFHKYRISRKLGVRTTPELTQYAIKHGLIS